VTEVRNANHDEAGRAVNAAILSVSMARELTAGPQLLLQIAMAAMMLDVARPRAASSSGMTSAPILSRLSEQAEDSLASGTAVVLTMLSRMNEATISRTVMTYEAQWLRRSASVGPRIRRLGCDPAGADRDHGASYNDLLTPDQAWRRPRQTSPSRP